MLEDTAPIVPDDVEEENEEMEEILDADMMLEEEGELGSTNECAFDMQMFVDKLAVPATMYALFLALGEFDRNPSRVTHCTLRLLHALTFARARPDPSLQLPLEAEQSVADAAISNLFQLRLLAVFRRLLSNKLFANMPEYKVHAAYTLLFILFSPYLV